MEQIVGDTFSPALVNQVTVTIFPICPIAGKIPICPFIPVTEVLYAGPAPFSVAGFYQVNIRIPVLSDIRSPGPRSIRVFLNSPDGPIPYASFFGHHRPRARALKSRNCKPGGRPPPETSARAPA
jgi:hypothetical protein